MIKGLTKKADNGEDMTSLVNVITKYVHIFLFLLTFLSFLHFLSNTGGFYLSRPLKILHIKQYDKRQIPLRLNRSNLMSATRPRPVMRGQNITSIQAGKFENH